MQCSGSTVWRGMGTGTLLVHLETLTLTAAVSLHEDDSNLRASAPAGETCQQAAATVRK
jgi:hypothetical protein